MGLIFKHQKGGRFGQYENIQLYHKTGRKWRYLGKYEDVFDILRLMHSNPHCVGVIKKILKYTTPHLGTFIEELGRNWRKWYTHEFIPLVKEKVLGESA